MRSYWEHRGELPVLVSPDEYRGQPAVIVSATQRDELSRTAAARLVDEWIAFFDSGPSPIRKLDFASRTPRRLFDALGGQTQLTGLRLKWGDYDRLEVLAGMHDLAELELRGASAVTDLAPLAGLGNVTLLVLEGLQRVSDLSPIGRMRSVVDLDVGGDWMSNRNAHVESIGFLDRMPQLRELLLHTLIVDDLDYSPLLRLPNIEQVRVKAARGMRPPLADLQAALPWSG